MARQGSGRGRTATADAPEATTQEENAVTETAEQAPATETEATTESTNGSNKQTLTDEQITEALSGFVAAMTEAVDNRAEDTGVPPQEYMDATSKAYAELDGQKLKNAAKKVVTEAMTEAMNAGEVYKARALFEVQEKSLVASKAAQRAKAERAPRKPADPTEAYVEVISTLELANELAQATVPDGVGENWAEKVAEKVSEQRDSANAYRAWVENDDEDKGDAPEVDDIASTAAKLSLGQSARPGRPRSRKASETGTTAVYNGPRRDIAKHIQEAFANEESGKFLKIAEIAKFTSTEYGDDPPSSGAISARLFPKTGKMTVEGIEAGQDENSRKGARKL